VSTNAFQAYLKPRIALMLALGFSSGLPFLLIFGTLSAWLREAHITRTAIGLMSYAGLGYAIKFLWAPVLDQVRLPFLDAALGKRRAWTLVSQIMVAAMLIAISFCDPQATLMPLAALAVALCFAAATQDISVDAWRIEAAGVTEQGAMAAAYQLGYRLAILASGAGALYIAQYRSWQIAYLTMAALMTIGVAATLLSPRVEEKPRTETQGDPRGIYWLYHAIIEPFIDFFSRHRYEGLLILALIGLYRVPDFVMGVMANPLYIDLGFSLATIATIVKLFGVGMTILGAIAGGVSVARFGILKSLLIGALAIFAGNLTFAWLATQGNQDSALAIAISASNFASGFAGTALVAYMSSLTNRAFTATQYALFSSFYALPGKLLGGQSGALVDWFARHPFVMRIGAIPAEAAGYVPFFLCTAAMAFPAMILILYEMRRGLRGHRA
jgi:MFS transporter, PAT family, beta-lactamase induction signal transducer AmpG